MKRHPSYTIRPLGANALPEILAMQDEALRMLPDPDILRANTPKMLGDCLSAPHSAIGAFSKDGELAGIAILFVPGLDEENIALAAGLSEEEAAASVNMKLVIVRPQHQGHGLQRKMMAVLEEEARQRGFLSLWTTVSPLNTFSRRNVLACGYQFVCEQRKYGGLLRELFTKPLN